MLVEIKSFQNKSPSLQCGRLLRSSAFHLASVVLPSFYENMCCCLPGVNRSVSDKITFIENSAVRDRFLFSNMTWVSMAHIHLLFGAPVPQKPEALAFRLILLNTNYFKGVTRECISHGSVVGCSSVMYPPPSWLAGMRSEETPPEGASETGWKPQQVISGFMPGTRMSRVRVGGDGS